MQIIQSIRDKGAAIVIVVISLSLIGFILMDANQGSGLFNSMSTDVGKVNGEKVEMHDFNNRVRMAEMMEQQRTGQAVTGVRTYQLRDEMWNQVVAEKIFGKEAEKLGIEFTSKELSYILLSNEPNNPLLQEAQLRDSVTGKLNIVEAQKAISNIKKFKGEQKANVDAQIIDPLKLGAMVAKYTGLLNASAYYPEWMRKKDATEANTYSHISYVMVPYSEMPDSTFKVTDAEVNDYVKKNQGMFKQEAGKMVSYLTFSQLPNAEDSARTENALSALRSEFAADTNVNAFLLRNSSVLEYDDEFKPKSAYGNIPVDSIVATNGNVYGPFVSGNNYLMGKLVASKSLPDSVRARHILIATQDRQTGQTLRDDSSAHRLADSLLAVLNAGGNFAALAAQYSSDGSKDNGGDLGTYGFGAMVEEFQDFTFNKPTGSRGVVRTQFGWHVIEVTNQKDFKPAYKLALMAKEILPGDATINAASLNATKASSLKDAKSLSEYAAKNGLSLTQNPTIVKENDYSIGTLQDARQLVRWVSENKVGAVSEPFAVGDNFVVATIDKAFKEGVQDAATARSGAEAMIIKEKKADVIIKKIGANPTVEAAASAYGKQVMEAGQDSTLTFTTQMIPGVGLEPKVIGASFNKNYQGKPSPAFGGTSGVFVIKINNIAEKPAPSAEEVEQRETTRLNTLRSQIGNWYENLRKQAVIKDNRMNHY